MITYLHIPVFFKEGYRVTRPIPGEGKIFVEVGQKVAAHQVVGEGSRSAGFRSFPLADLLGVKPNEVKRTLKKVIGSHLYPGDLIAEVSKFGGLKKIEFRSPMEGILKYYDEKLGLLSIEYPPTLIKIPAGFGGQVKSIQPRKAVEIETKVALIYGRLGLGREREGVLSVIPNPEVPITPEQITASYSGKIIVGGSLLSKEVLYKSLAVQAHGIVTGGINWRDFWQVSGRGEEVEDVGITILLTEGFGNLPIQRDLYELLKQNDGRYVSLQGAKRRLILPLGESDYLKARPTVSEFPSRPQSKERRVEPASERVNFPTGKTLVARGRVRAARFPQLTEDEVRLGFGPIREGDSVRILSPPFLANFGKILSIAKEPTPTESGLWVRQCLIEVGDKEIEVPTQNVEVIR